MQLPVTYVWTHDSIGLGEDGPTHQPIEHLAALRAIPGLDVVRPADANEVSVAWRTILEHNDRPAGIILSRQNLPVFDRGTMESAEGVARGGYVLAEASSGTPEVILMGTGSEVQIAVAAREALEADGVPTRVVSLPCVEWFADQDEAYRSQVLPPTVRARVSVEAAVPMGWREFVGDAGRIVGLNHYGASAAYTVLYEEFGLTSEAVVAAARESIAAAAADPVARPAPAPPAAAWTAPPATADPHVPQTVPRREGHEMTQNQNLAQLSKAGVAVWLDDLSRDRIRSGNLQSLVDEQSVVGVTTNPTIFAAAISGSESYDHQLHALAIREVSVEEALRTITATDVRDACDLLRPVHERQPGDGRVSLEVAPGLAHETDATEAEAEHLWWLVDRPNLYIKIPATEAGLPAISDTIAKGISVNVTLIFSLERYRAVMDAYLSGLEKRVADGGSLDGIASVASFFVSRVDTEIDKRLDKARRRPRAQGQGGHRQRAAGLPGLRGGLHLRPLAGARGEGRRAAATAVGLDRRQEPRVQRHHVHQRADRARHGQHHAREDDVRLRRPRQPRHAGAEGLRRRDRGAEVRQPRPASTWTTSSACSRTRACRSSSTPGTS